MTLRSTRAKGQPWKGNRNRTRSFEHVHAALGTSAHSLGGAGASAQETRRGTARASPSVQPAPATRGRVGLEAREPLRPAPFGSKRAWSSTNHPFLLQLLCARCYFIVFRPISIEWVAGGQEGFQGDRPGFGGRTPRGEGLATEY